MARSFISVAEAAEQLGISEAAARERIDSGQLMAIRRDDPERTLVPISSLRAHQRRLAGERPPPLPRTGPSLSVAQRRANFAEENGCGPEQWNARWEADEIEDSAENMGIAITAWAILSAEAEAG